MERVIQGGIVARVIRGVSYAGAGNVALRILDGIAAFFLLWSLSVYEYGIYTLALAAYGFWTMVFLPGIENLIVTDVSGDGNRAHARSVFSVYAYFLVTAGAILATGFWLMHEKLGYWVDGYDEYLIIVAWLFVLASFETLFRMKTSIFLDFGWNTAIRIIRSVVHTAIVVGAAAVGALTVATALWSIVLSLAFALFVALIGYRRERLLSRITLSDIHEFWRREIRPHGKWAIAEDMFNSLSQNVRPFLVKFFVGAEAVALIALAQNLNGYAKSLFPVRDILFPIFPRAESREDLMRYADKSMKYATWGFVLLTPIAAIGATSLVYLLFPKYIPALSVFYILMIALPFFGIRSVAIPIFYRLKVQKDLFYIIVSRSALSIVLALILIYLFGTIGAAVELVILGIITAVSYLSALRRELPGWSFGLKSLFVFDAEDRRLLRLTWSAMVKRIPVLRFIYE